MDISNSTINKAGEIIRRGEKDKEFEKAVEILNLWREAHGAIMDEYYDKCVKLKERIDPKNIIVAQRLKRLPTIIGKLGRFKSMRLASMQDVAGIRIIVEDMAQLTKIEKTIKKWTGFKKESDYLDYPKPSGYRGKHLIFKKDGMMVEIQLRTSLQHLWATSVETVDILNNSSLKFRIDNSYWHDFFCQVSSIFAVAEGTKVLDEYQGKSLNQIRIALRNNMSNHKINSQIRSFAFADLIVDDERVKNSYYYVITLDFNRRKAKVSGYKDEKYHSAVEEYQRLERENDNNEQTVLVAVDQIRKVKEAYPNYFMNLDSFLSIIDFLLENLNE